jgi:hypothetical protein
MDFYGASEGSGGKSLLWQLLSLLPDAFQAGFTKSKKRTED